MTDSSDVRDPDDKTTQRPQLLSDWLRDRDVASLGTVARGARLDGRSFGERLIERG